MDYILVPFKFNESSKNALKYALNIASHFKWEVLLLNVVTPKFVVGYEQAMPIEMDDLKESTNHQLSSFIKKLGAESAKVKSVAEVGFPPDVIKKHSQDSKCVLVVMGSKGTKGIGSLLLGNMASSVISKIDTPILLVPELVNNYSIDRILFATNFTLDDEVVGNEIIALAKLFNSKVFCMHISSNKKLQEDQNKMQNLEHQMNSKKYGVDINYEVIQRNDDSKEQIIYSYINQNNIDLLAVHTNHRNNLLQQINQPSLTRKLALSLRHPILIFS